MNTLNMCHKWIKRKLFFSFSPVYCTGFDVTNVHRFEPRLGLPRRKSWSDEGFGDLGETGKGEGCTPFSSVGQETNASFTIINCLKGLREKEIPFDTWVWWLRQRGASRLAVGPGTPILNLRLGRVRAHRLPTETLVKSNSRKDHGVLGNH